MTRAWLRREPSAITVMAQASRPVARSGMKDRPEMGHAPYRQRHPGEPGAAVPDAEADPDTACPGLPLPAPGGLPAHSLAAADVPEGEQMRPSVQQLGHQRLGPEPAAVPGGEDDQVVDHRRGDEYVVDQPHPLR